MAKLKDGYYKQTAEAIGSDLHVLLAGGGSKALSDFATSTGVVTALGTSGNYVTWTKNGTANNLTVPYATKAGTLDCFTKRTTANCTWGTLIASNGYTPIYWGDSASGGGIGFSDKGGQTFMQIDGDYYAQEGAYKVWHAGNLTKVSQLTNDAGYLTSLPSHTHSYVPYGGVVFTPANAELTSADVLSLTGGWSMKKGTWDYAGNGYIKAGSFGNIDLAGTSVLTFGGSSAYTQLFITAPTQSGHTGITNEMLFYNDHGADYHPAWTRVLTNRNYNAYAPKLDGTGASGTWGINISGNAATATIATKDVDGNAFKTTYLRQVVVPNNTTNDFNTFENMTLTGRVDPTTGASLVNAPWTGEGPAGGYGVLTYFFNGSGYGTQMAWGYNSNRIYIRPKYYSNGYKWATTWDSLALTSDIPTKVSQLTNDSGYITSSSIPSSLKNPNSISFKNAAGTTVSYDGSSALDLTGGIRYAATSTSADYSGTLLLHDIRGTAHAPNSTNYPEYKMAGWFNNTGTPTGAWHSGFTVKGWTNDYASWQLCSYSSTDTSNNHNLYFRSGVNSTWGDWKTVLDSSNYTTYTVKKDGTGATGTWGISITGSSGSCTGNAATANSTAVWASSAVSTNLDTVENRHGWANSSGSATNLPTSVSAGTLVSFSNSSSKLQFFGGYKTTHGLYYRKWYNSSWEGWRTILDSDNWTSFISIPSVGNGTVTINQAGASKGSFTLNQSTAATINLDDTNYYPTAFSWTGGTTAGPTGSLTGVGMSAVSFGAIPAASSTTSGIVTTGNQSFSGQKTFNTFIFANYMTPISDTTGCGIGTSAWRYHGGYFENLYTTYIYMCPRTYSGTLYLTGFKDTPSSISTVDAQLYASSYVKVQNSASSSAAVYAPGGFYESSDERLKNLLKPVRVDLDELSKLRKVYYTWKNSSDLGIHLGIVAQDVQKLYPELVTVDSETGYLSLSYDKLSVIALEAIDALYKSYKELKRRVDTLEKLITNKGIL